MKLPESYQQLMPYLIVPDAEKFISFMKTVFGAKERLHILRSENVIRHAEINVGDCVIMLDDATEEYKPRPGAFFIYVENADETYRIALENGATSLEPLSDRDYGRTCGILD